MVGDIGPREQSVFIISRSPRSFLNHRWYLRVASTPFKILFLLFKHIFWSYMYQWSTRYLRQCLLVVLQSNVICFSDSSWPCRCDYYFLFDTSFKLFIWMKYQIVYLNTSFILFIIRYFIQQNYAEYRNSV